MLISLNIYHPGSTCPSGRIRLFRKAQTLSPERGDHTEAPQGCCPGASFLTPYSQLGRDHSVGSNLYLGPETLPHRLFLRNPPSVKVQQQVSVSPIFASIKTLLDTEIISPTAVFPTLFPEGPTSTQGRHELADL